MKSVNHDVKDVTMDIKKHSKKRIKTVQKNIWKAFNSDDWGMLYKNIRKLKGDHYIVIHSTKKIPIHIESLILQFSRPVNCLIEIAPIIHRLMITYWNSNFYNYNEFIISTYLFSLFKASKNQIVFIKPHNLEHIIISCYSSNFIDLESIFLAIVGNGENYKIPVTITHQRSENSSWVINCKILLSTEKKDRTNTYSIVNKVSEKNNLEQIKMLAGGSYASTSLTKEKFKNRYGIYKCAKENGFEKLRDEILWLGNLPNNAKNLFPELLQYEINSEKKECWMHQKYYPWPSVTSYLMNGGFSKYSNYYHNTIEIINFLIEVMKTNKNLFYLHKVKDTPSDFFMKYHKNKFEVRLSEAISENNELEPIITSNYLYLNGDKLLGPFALLEKFEMIDKEIKNIVRPPYLCTLHGDLNLGNILVDPDSFKECDENYSKLSYKFIDPRGWIDYNTQKFMGQDYIYDFAKIAYHFFGYYDQVRSNMVQVGKKSIENEIPVFSIHFPHFKEATKEFCNPAAKLYYTLQSAMLNYLIEEKNLFDLEYGSKWKVRFMFTLGSCMITDIPFLLKGPDGFNKALVILLLGTRFFNYAFELAMKFIVDHYEYSQTASIFEIYKNTPTKWKKPLNKKSMESILYDMADSLSPIGTSFLPDSDEI